MNYSIYNELRVNWKEINLHDLHCVDKQRILYEIS